MLYFLWSCVTICGLISTVNFLVEALISVTRPPPLMINSHGKSNFWNKNIFFFLFNYLKFFLKGSSAVAVTSFWLKSCVFRWISQGFDNSLFGILPIPCLFFFCSLFVPKKNVSQWLKPRFHTFENLDLETRSKKEKKMLMSVTDLISILIVLLRRKPRKKKITEASLVRDHIKIRFWVGETASNYSI